MMHQVNTERFWNGTDLPLQGKLNFCTRDINEVHRHMSRAFCPHDLFLEDGNPPIDFRHHQASLKSLSFNATDYGNPYGRVRLNIPPSGARFFHAQFPLSGVAQIRQGSSRFELRPGEMCVLDSEAECGQVFAKAYKHFTVKISKESLEAVLGKELGFHPGPLEFHSGPVPLTGAMASYVQLIRTVCDDLHMASSIFSNPRSSSSLEWTLQSLLLAATPHNHSDLLNAPETTVAPYYVRRVVEFIHERATEQISLEDMIAVSGVSARSLHAGFRKFRDTTPMKFLKQRRLALAREQLQRARSHGKSVSEIALDCGFAHLSKFSLDYYKRFGERPSETLLFSARSS
jgi:AraC-like DNA-binding protein